MPTMELIDFVGIFLLWGLATLLCIIFNELQNCLARPGPRAHQGQRSAEVAAAKPHAVTATQLELSHKLTEVRDLLTYA